MRERKLFENRQADCLAHMITSRLPSFNQRYCEMVNLASMDTLHSLSFNSFVYNYLHSISEGRMNCERTLKCAEGKLFEFRLHTAAAFPF